MTAQVPPQPPDSEFISVPAQRGLGRWHASRSVLWAKLQGMESTLRLLHARARQEDQRLYEQLLYRLGLAKACIEDTRGRPRVRLDETRFWALVHGVAADMLLIMPEDMLATQALEVEEQFRRNIQDSFARQTWLGPDGAPGPLPKAVQQVLDAGGGKAAAEDKDLSQARNVLRGALHLVNEQSETHFRQLAFALLVRSLSGALLVLLFASAFFFAPGIWLPGTQQPEPPFRDLPLPLVSLLLLGAAGAILANMTSEPQVLAARGPVWRQFVYYLFVRPAIGAFAAFLFYLLARSQLLFGIEQAESKAPAVQPPAIRIVLSSALAVKYAYAIISIVVGFSADRALGTAMDQVLNRLLRVADKTVQTPDIPTPPTSLRTVKKHRASHPSPKGGDGHGVPVH